MQVSQENIRAELGQSLFSARARGVSWPLMPSDGQKHRGGCGERSGVPAQGQLSSARHIPAPPGPCGSGLNPRLRVCRLNHLLVKPGTSLPSCLPSSFTSVCLASPKNRREIFWPWWQIWHRSPQWHPVHQELGSNLCLTEECFHKGWKLSGPKLTNRNWKVSLSVFEPLLECLTHAGETGVGGTERKKSKGEIKASGSQKEKKKG